MRTTTIFCCLLSLALFALRCDPNDSEPATQDFSCIKIFDANGTGLGLHGGCTSSADWGDIPLNANESGLVDFSDTVGLAGTAAASVAFIAAFPNPVVRGDALYLSVRGDVTGQPVKIELAIADESLSVISQFALRTTVNGSFALQMDTAKFQSGQYYRLYYRVSAEGNASLFEGYGNILVCKTYISGGNTIEADCM